MSLVTRVHRLRDRPIAEHQQRTVLTAIFTLLMLATLLLASTRAASDKRQLLAKPTASPSIAAPSKAALPEALVVRVAREFLAGYLAYAYGHTSARHIHGTTSALRRSLEAPVPRVTPAMRASHPHIVGVRAQSAGGERTNVTALINDGALIDYPISLVIARQRHRLLVFGLGDS
jgi:hypothetical protein